jgi:hypothetical protein
MNKLQTILIIVGAVIVMPLALFSLTSWISDNYHFERVNFCGHTMKEANNPVHWNNGVYSPIGCDLSKYNIVK